MAIGRPQASSETITVFFLPVNLSFRNLLQSKRSYMESKKKNGSETPRGRTGIKMQT